MKYASISHQKNGFTIVELVVIIAVIVILATISVMSYTTVISEAHIKAIETDLRSSASALKKYRADNGSYPENFSEIDQFNSSGETMYVYAYDDPTSSYCLQASAYDTTYFITSASTSPTEGSCP